MPPRRKRKIDRRGDPARLLSSRPESRGLQPAGALARPRREEKKEKDLLRLSAKSAVRLPNYLLRLSAKSTVRLPNSSTLRLKVVMRRLW